MRDSTGNEIQWCDRYTEFDLYYQLPETKCPDLGDWSDTPHDQLDKLMHPWEIMVINARIRLDRERLLSYIED